MLDGKVFEADISFSITSVRYLCVVGITTEPTMTRALQTDFMHKIRHTETILLLRVCE